MTQSATFSGQACGSRFVMHARVDSADAGAVKTARLMTFSVSAYFILYSQNACNLVGQKRKKIKIIYEGRAKQHCQESLSGGRNIYYAV